MKSFFFISKTDENPLLCIELSLFSPEKNEYVPNISPGYLIVLLI